jgi:hypothetical protein
MFLFRMAQHYVISAFDMTVRSGVVVSRQILGRADLH